MEIYLIGAGKIRNLRQTIRWCIYGLNGKMGLDAYVIMELPISVS